MKILAVSQARMGSTRLPGKISKKIMNKSLLAIHIERILQSKKIDTLLIASTVNKEDDLIEGLIDPYPVLFYRGSQNDVLDRFYKATVDYKPDYVVRLTSDCPLIDPKLIDAVIEKAISENVDYCSNCFGEKFPDGQDVEVFKFSALEKAWKESTKLSDREHVTPYIRNNSTLLGGTLFNSVAFDTNTNYNHVRLTVDEELDFLVVKEIIEHLGVDKTWEEYTSFYLNNNDINKLNKSITRNEGYIKSLNND